MSHDEKDLRKRIRDALEIAFTYSQIDGSHHKEWSIDQMVRCLTGSDYDDFVRTYKDGEDGPETYAWSVGIPP